MAPRGQEEEEMGKNNVLLTASVALFSYFPSETVAKLTLMVAALMFMLNPFPLARLVSVICILILSLLNRTRKAWEEGQEEVEVDHEEEEIEKTHKD